MCGCAVLRPGETCPAHPFDPTAYKRPDDGAGAPPPAPAPSLVSGVIGRSLADTLQARYRQQLDELWREVLAGLPDD